MNPAQNEELTRLRSLIDTVDGQVISLLARRMDICRQIGEIKKSGGADIVQEGRREEVRARLKTLAAKESLSEEFVLRLYDAVHEESVRVQSGAE